MIIFGDTGLLFAYKQWGYATNCNASSQRVRLPISFLSNNASLAVAITDYGTPAACDDLTCTDFRYRGAGSMLPNLRWIAVGR